MADEAANQDPVSLCEACRCSMFDLEVVGIGALAGPDVPLIMINKR